MLTRLPGKLANALQENPVVSDLLEHWGAVGLPDCWIVAGVVVQSYWNRVHELPAMHGVSDIDLIYYEPNDLTESSESREARRISEFFEHLGVRFDVKNQARVHLWYEARFGYPIEPYRSSAGAIDTFPTKAGSIGIRPTLAEIEAYATFGFDDLLNMKVRPNKRQVTREIYWEKVSRWKELWPMLVIVDWDEA